MSKGIEVRHGSTGSSIRIRFFYRGREYRELLRLEPTKSNLAYAERLRGEVLNQIERGTFDYRRTFPNGKNAAAFGQVDSRETVGDRLDAFVKRCELARDLGNLAPSTLRNYSTTVRCQLKPAFGSIPLSELSPAVIRKWVEGLGVTAKTARNWLSPLRMTLDDAVNDGAIQFSPLERVKLSRSLGLTAKKSEYSVDPFSPEEVARILEKAGPHRPLFQFAFATGLRTSELVALEWPDIDMKGRVARIRRAVVVQEVKGPKTESGNRDVELTDEALAALQAVRGIAGRVFINPNTRDPFIGDKPIRIAWGKILTAAKIEYRNPYQTRHTFASSLLSAGANPWWVAEQMGHKDVTMIFRTYGRWIPGAKKSAQMPPAPTLPGRKSA